MQFRSFLFLSKINKIYGNNANVKASDVEQFIRYLFLAAMQDRPSIPEIEKPINPIFAINYKPFYDFDSIYLSLNPDNPLLSRVFLRYLIKGLQFLSFDEVVEFKTLLDNYINFFQNDVNPENQINSDFALLVELVKLSEYLSNYQKILLNDKFKKLLKKPDFDSHIPDFFSNPMSIEEKWNYVAECMKQENVSDYTFLQKLSKEFTHNFKDLFNFFQYLEPDSYFWFESLVTELCVSVEQLIALYKIKKQDVFFEVFGEELLNRIQNEAELIYLFENVENKKILNLVFAYPKRLLQLINL